MFNTPLAKIIGLVLILAAAFLGYRYLNQGGLNSDPALAPSTQLGAVATVGTGVLGKNTVGSELDYGSTNAMNAFAFTMPNESGQAKSISVYIANTEAGSRYSLAIYSHDPVTNHPSQLIANTDVLPINSDGWYSASIDAGLEAGKTYWLVYNADAAQSRRNVLSIHPNAGRNAYRFHSFFAGWPALFGRVDGSGTAAAAIYVTYDKLTTITDPNPPPAGY